MQGYTIRRLEYHAAGMREQEALSPRNMLVRVYNVYSKDTQGRHQGVNSLQLWGGGYMRNSGTAMGGCGGMQFNKCGTEDLFNNV